MNPLIAIHLHSYTEASLSGRRGNEGEASAATNKKIIMIKTIPIYFSFLRFPFPRPNLSALISRYTTR